MADSKKLIEFADSLAQELVQYAHQHEMDARELLMGVVLTERLLQQVFPGTKGLVRDVVLEGHATFDALVHPPRADELN